MNRFVFLPVLIAGVAAAGSAYAQWQFSSGLGVRQFYMAETDTNGRDMVREHGWLPGVELRADYVMRDWRVGISGDFYRHQITYDGQMQSSTPFATDTGTTQSRIGIDISNQVTDTARLIGGIEWDRWQRDIYGRGNVLGLNELYTSWRLLAGVQMRVWQADWGLVHAKASIVRAAPEKLRVRFENRLYDDASLSTRAATGLRFALGLQPSACPSITLITELDWMRIGRSEDAVLYRGGVPVGLVTQAEHARRTFSMRVNYRF